MRIRKAVFPVGGLGTRFFPITRAIPKEMLGILDKPLIHYAFEEAVAAGIEQFILVTRHGKAAIEDYFDYMFSHRDCFSVKISSICYVRQNEPKGLGHAVLCARDLIGNEPFPVLSVDDFIMGSKSCIGEMSEHYNGANMVATMEVDRSDVDKYGIIDVERKEGSVIFAKSVTEKPSVVAAKSNFAIIGRYLLSPEIFSVLENLSPGVNGEVQLTDALEKMISICGLEGFLISGKRFDCGSKEGLLAATLHVANCNSTLRYVIDRFIGERV